MCCVLPGRAIRFSAAPGHFHYKKIADVFVQVEYRAEFQKAQVHIFMPDLIMNPVDQQPGGYSAICLEFKPTRLLDFEFVEHEAQGIEACDPASLQSLLVLRDDGHEATVQKGDEQFPLARIQ